jgi:EAL domain-containing protein (putative c-di-GMP-specific phosphodiesterase class I)
MGRNAYRFYDADMNVATLQYLKLMSALRKAVQTGELRTFFQPKIRLSDGCLVGSEALVRWVHPEEGLLLPARFIGAAERTDLIVSIGNWVLDDVCRQLAIWRDAGFPPMTVAVNVSARHVSEPGLAERLQELLDQYRLPPHSLELELTESTLLETGEDTLSTLEKLKLQGVNLAIDDFGMGYSSLSYLKHLPLASLKIDRSFVRDMTTDADDRTIAATVVALGHSLGLKVVAEGVESEQQRDILISQGCDFAQGHLFSQALSSEDFTVWWQRHLAGHEGLTQIGRIYDA